MSEMERFQVGDRVQWHAADGGRFEGGRVLETRNHDTDRTRVAWDNGTGAGNYWYSDDELTLVSRAETPEPEWRVGERVGWNHNAELRGTVVAVQNHTLVVAWDHAGPTDRPAENMKGHHTKLPQTFTPATPVTVQDGAAMLPTPTTEPPEWHKCRICSAPIAELVHAHRGQAACSVECWMKLEGRRDDDMSIDLFIEGRSHAAARESQPEPKPAPRVGDLCSAWYQAFGGVPERIVGVMVEDDTCDSRCIVLRRSKWLHVCLRAGAEVVTPKEAL